MVGTTIYNTRNIPSGLSRDTYQGQCQHKNTFTMILPSAMHTHNHDQGVASAFHGETHTMWGYPRTVETCNWSLYIYTAYSQISDILLRC